MSKANISYDAKTNTASIDVHSSNIIPGYLFYLLQSLNIPTNATIKYKDKTVIIDKQKHKFKYKEVN